MQLLLLRVAAIPSAMNLETAIEKLKLAGPSSFHVLDAAKAARMKARTMFIPSPDDVAVAIRAIPHGSTKTVVQLRNDLAAMGNADTACPVATIKYWKWLALVSASQGSPHADPSFPWWRVLKDGKPSRHLPGGMEAQVLRLQAEGIVATSPGPSNSGI